MSGEIHSFLLSKHNMLWYNVKRNTIYSYTEGMIMGMDFWKALLIRTVKTWCQAFVAVIGIDSFKTLGDVDWKYALSVATLAAIVCFFMNLGAGLPEVKLTQTVQALDNDPEDFGDDEEGDM